MKRNGMAYGTPKVVGHRDDKWNWARPDGTLVLRGEWADSVGGFSQGWGCFQRKGDKKWNFVDADGRLLSDEWFVSVQPFGDKKEDPAAVKRGGRWYALYGRRPDGGPDLSEKSVETSGLSIFSYGLAVAGDDGHGFCYVDASMNSVGPGGFPFAYATIFESERYGGNWAEVEIKTQAGQDKRRNLFGRDGTLAFGGDEHSIPTVMEKVDGALETYYGGRDDDSAGYVFPIFGDWERIGRLGFRKEAGRPVPGLDGRLYMKKVRDRMTGKMREGVAAIFAVDSLGKEHLVWIPDGNEGKNG